MLILSDLLHEQPTPRNVESNLWSSYANFRVHVCCIRTIRKTKPPVHHSLILLADRVLVWSRKLSPWFNK